MKRSLLAIAATAALLRLAAACGGPASPGPSSASNHTKAEAEAGAPASPDTAQTRADAGEAIATPAKTTAVDAPSDAGAAPAALSARDFVGDGGATLLEWKVGGGYASVTGGARKPVDVKAILDANLPAAARCYGPALKRNPKLRGTLKLRMTIEADGAISSVADDGGSEVTEGELLKCTFAAYKKVKFPKSTPKSKDLVVYPIVFGPETS